MPVMCMCVHERLCGFLVCVFGIRVAVSACAYIYMFVCVFVCV